MARRKSASLKTLAEMPGFMARMESSILDPATIESLFCENCDGLAHTIQVVARAYRDRIAALEKAIQLEHATQHIAFTEDRTPCSYPVCRALAEQAKQAAAEGGKNRAARR